MKTITRIAKNISAENDLMVGFSVRTPAYREPGWRDPKGLSGFGAPHIDVACINGWDSVSVVANVQGGHASFHADSLDDVITALICLRDERNTALGLPRAP